MKFDRTVFNFDIYGEKVTVNKLNTNDLLVYQKALEKCEKDSDATEATIDMLERQGIKKDISQEMEVEHLNKLVDMVCGTSAGK